MSRNQENHDSDNNSHKKTYPLLDRLFFSNNFQHPLFIRQLFPLAPQVGRVKVPGNWGIVNNCLGHMQNLKNAYNTHLNSPNYVMSDYEFKQLAKFALEAQPVHLESECADPKDVVDVMLSSLSSSEQQALMANYLGLVAGYDLPTSATYLNDIYERDCECSNSILQYINESNVPIDLVLEASLNYDNCDYSSFVENTNNYVINNIDLGLGLGGFCSSSFDNYTTTAYGASINFTCLTLGVIAFPTINNPIDWLCYELLDLCIETGSFEKVDNNGTIDLEPLGSNTRKQLSTEALYAATNGVQQLMVNDLHLGIIRPQPTNLLYSKNLLIC